MASYSTMSTIPAADVETEQPLLKRDVKLNVKTVLAGAAAAAFILGAAAATAMSASAAPKQMDFGASFFPVAKNIELASNHNKCILSYDQGKPMQIHNCKKTEGQFKQIIGSGPSGTTVKYAAYPPNGLCLTALRGDADDFSAGMSFGMFRCAPEYDAWQTFEEDGSYVTQLKLAAQDLCASAQGKGIIAEPCDGSSKQTFRTLPSDKSDIREESLPKGYWG